MSTVWIETGRAGGEDEPGVESGLEALAERACERAGADLGGDRRPLAAWVALSPGRGSGAPGPALEAAVGACQRALAARGVTRVVIGTASGYLDGRGDACGPPFVSVVLVGGGRVGLACVRQPTSEPGVTGEALAQRLDVPPAAGGAVLVALDASRLLLEAEVEALEGGVGGSSVVGGAAASVAGGAGRIWVCDGEWGGPAAMAGLWIAGEAPARAAVLPGHRGLDPCLAVTAARGSWIERLDGRPALRVLGPLAGSALMADPGRACRALRLELTGVDGRVRLQNLTGFDPSRGALSVAGMAPAPGTRLRLLQRDAESARRELAGVQVRGEVGGVFYVACASRSASLFGHEGIESGTLASAVRPVPVAGWYTPSPFAGRPARSLPGAGVAVFLS